MKQLHIIGGGISGLSTAVKAVDNSWDIHLYEATPHFGGRCRSYHDEALNCTIDNGNHLALASNPTLWQFAKAIKAQGGFYATAKKLPYYDLKSGQLTERTPPFFLPKSLPLKAYLALATFRFSPLKKTLTVRDLFPAETKLAREFIDPLCISMLNTQPEQADAALFKHTLQCIIRIGRKGAQAYLPKRDWHDALIAPSLVFLQNNNVTLNTHHRLKSIIKNGAYVQQLNFTTSDGETSIDLAPSDRVILALPAHETTKLGLNIHAPTEFSPILNIHFRYHHNQPIPSFIGVLGGITEWIFFKNNIISTTTSAANSFIKRDNEELAQTIWKEVCAAMNLPNNTPLPPHRIIKEKRATFLASSKQLQMRPACQTQFINLFLAGDFTDTGLPATIEGAIQSGVTAAQGASAAH